MQNPSSFSIYDASAGSGKTFALVKEYLKILFRSKSKEQYKHILAITFTNKAVAEMKTRIINALKDFSDETILVAPNSLFELLCEELQMSAEVIHKKSKTALESIIYNYAAFEISTIDGFIHKLIRTFAYDLQLPLNFEVELDAYGVLNEAVEQLLNKAGTDDELTKLLVDFAIEKADDVKSWDITFDFNKIATTLIRENDLPFIETFKDKNLADFKTLKKHVKKQISTKEEFIVDQAQSILTLIEEAGLQYNDFSSSYLPKHFVKLSRKDLSVNYKTKWQENIEIGILYPKKADASIAKIIDDIQPQIASVFNITKEAVFKCKFLKAFYKNITPLAVLNAIKEELNFIKEDQNKMLISEFNSIISNEIRDQPTPFIYERLGEKYQHYFIDEFQDTSVLQWENLIPLIDNSLSSENGSAMLVGDAKQAIYRWRGGKAEQFIGLLGDDNPFQIKKDIVNLSKNYRSFKEIIKFNNGFFKFLSTIVFSHQDYQKLYENVQQETFLEQEGYVNLSFLEINKEDDKNELYPKKVLETIKDCISNGFKLSDICVLVRKNQEGVSIANYLKDYDIDVVSSDILLIQHSSEVTFINNTLRLLLNPEANDIKILVLTYLAEKLEIEDKHAFYKIHLDLSLEAFFKNLGNYGFHISSDELLQMSLYDMVESMVREFHLIKMSNAYIQFYLDEVLSFVNKKGSDVLEFLSYFEKKKDNLNIVVPQGQDAIQVMTVHKSKGLEFPVVIFPYAELDIYRENDPKEWISLNEDEYQGFSHTLLNYNKDFENYGDQGKEIYDSHQSQLELDNINLLYVALTRSVEQLYIISKKDIDKNGVSKGTTYSSFFIKYLQSLSLWDSNKEIYTFGNSQKAFSQELKTLNIEEQSFASTSKQSNNINIITKSAYLWDTDQKEAIEKGNLVHYIMSLIKTEKDVDFALNDLRDQGVIVDMQLEELRQTVLKIVNNSQLKNYFNDEDKIYNEKDIISKGGAILRPDRLIVNSRGEAVIIDYKTGKTDKKHQSQLQVYHNVLEEMNLKVTKKILVYINDSVSVEVF